MESGGSVEVGDGRDGGEVSIELGHVLVVEGRRSNPWWLMIEVSSDRKSFDHPEYTIIIIINS